MIVYQETKDGFLRDTFERDIEDVVLGHFRRRVGQGVARSVVQSWRNSLVAAARAVNHPSVPGDCGVGIEYGIPQTSKRIDLVLSGAADDGARQLVIVELKQWQSAGTTLKDGVVTTRFARGAAEVSHPSYQAWSYASLLRDFNEYVYEHKVGLAPCAYLHNYTDDGVLSDPRYVDYTERAPLFFKGDHQRKRLREFIARHLCSGDRGKLLYEIDGSRIRPSKGLIDALNGMLAGNTEFVLVDDQKVVYETALQAARSAGKRDKQVVIIEGGPGTGKSVVAVNLLAVLTSEGQLVQYVTKNAAPRAVFQAKLTGSMRKSRIASLFRSSGSFIDTPQDSFDTLVVDEAHRLNEKSGLYANLGKHQVKELIDAAKCSVFFIDDDQRVTWKDIGEKAEIARLARKAGADVTHLKLESQFRCNGSDGYLAWLDDALGIRATANQKLDTSEFDFRVYDSPTELRSEIERRNLERNRARMVAGYCWDWKSKKSPRAMDVVIPGTGFEMQWNLTRDGGLWIVAEDSIDQIGCIHTCQGLEVDYIGVVIGPDLMVRDGEVVTRPEARSRQDQSIKGYKKALREDPIAAREKADRIVRNTYRTLMTRGMKGCYVYFVDKQAARHFRSRLQADSS